MYIVIILVTYAYDQDVFEVNIFKFITHKQNSTQMLND